MRVAPIITTCSILVHFALWSSAQTCDSQKAIFAELNRPLIFQSEADWKRLDTSQYESFTERAHDYVKQQIIERLGSGRADAKEIQAFIACFQSLPEYNNFREETNTPVVFSLRSNPPAVAAAYYIYRGGSAIPDTRPYLEVYLRDRSGAWKWIADSGASFGKSTFFVYEISAPLKTQHWFLMGGFVIGDTGTRLHLEIAAFDGKSLRTIWTKSGLAHTTLAEVHPHYIVLSRYTGYREGHDVFESERLDVVAGGLQAHTGK